MPHPVIDLDDLAKLMYVNEHGENPGFKAFAIDGLFPVRDAGDVGRPTEAGGRALAEAIDEVRHRVSAAIADGANVIVLSDRNSTTELAPIPSLLLVAAVHHHLVREKTRTQVGLVVETGDAREVHHMALLIGYGAAAVNPYLALESIDDMIANGQLDGSHARARPGRTTSRPPARACSRSCRRWASRRSPPTPAPRCSRRSASTRR